MEDYSFIKHAWLKIKIDETYDYIKFLFNIERKNINKNIHSSINRDLLIHSTSILEWIITYYIFEYYENCSQIQKDKFNKLLIRIEYKESNKHKDLLIKSENKKLVLCIKKEKFSKDFSKLNFWNLISISWKLKLFEKEIINKLKEIQDIRNDLHIQKVLEDNIFLDKITDEKLFELLVFVKEIEKIIKKWCNYNK